MTLGWPVLDYPKSTDQESETLDKVRQALLSGKNSIGAIILEPVNW